MDEANKLPLKRVELSLSKFNEVAIPHHLDLLRQHKANIIKYEECGAYGRVRAEQSSAARAAGRLRALLEELEALRRQVRPQDHARFDHLTQRSRELTLKAIMDYLGVIESSCRALVYSTSARRTATETTPLSVNRRAGEAGASERYKEGLGEGEGQTAYGSVVSTESVGVVAHVDANEEQIQLRVDEEEMALREREAVLVGWSALQSEVRALHGAWQHVQAAALAQRDDVGHAARALQSAGHNVAEARGTLAAAERLRAAAWAAGGAAVGALCGGPVGLAVGVKAGAAAALAGSLLGYLGVRRFAHRALRDAPSPPPPPPPAAAPREKED